MNQETRSERAAQRRAPADLGSGSQAGKAWVWSTCVILRSLDQHNLLDVRRGSSELSPTSGSASCTTILAN